MKPDAREQKVAELGGFLPRSEECGEPYDGGTWAMAAGANGGKWQPKMMRCTKPKGHGPEEQFDPPSHVYMSEGPVHGRRGEGPHGRHCPCGCHDSTAFFDDCSRCWPMHLPFDGCMVCAETIRAAGENPTSGHWYLVLVFKSDRVHDHFALSDIADLKGIGFTVG